MEQYFSGQMGLQLLPDSHGQIFGRTHLPLHKIYIQVQVLVIQFVQHLFFYDLAQLLYIKQKAGIGIGFALDGNKKLIIMTMPMFIGAFAKYSLILLFAPLGVVQLMGCIKMFNTGEVHHRPHYQFKNAQE